MTTEPADSAAGIATAGWQTWMDTFADLTDDLATVPATSCPNCSAQTLRTAFIGPPGLGAASGYLWCDTCLHGVAVSRMGVPSGADVIPVGVPQADWPIVMPDYTLVWPEDED